MQRCCDEPILVCPTFEVVSGAADSDYLGVGSDPFGSVAGTALPIPVAPSVPNNRYLFRLCTVSIPSGRVAIIKGLRTYISLRAYSVGEVIDPDPPVEIPVTSPMWHFLDGNVSWHLRTLGENFYDRKMDSPQAAGTSPQISGQDSALLYVTPLTPYTAPGQGRPPGEPVSRLGTWRDMRFPWTKTSWDLHQPVPGPCTIVLYGSVKQTDPAARPPIGTFTDPGAVGPEDRFLANFEAAAVQVRYGHIAAAMTIKLLPCNLY